LNKLISAINIFKINGIFAIRLLIYHNKLFEFDFYKQKYFFKNKINATNVANLKRITGKF